jgi:hypothetical protein
MWALPCIYAERPVVAPDTGTDNGQTRRDSFRQSLKGLGLLGKCGEIPNAEDDFK